MGLAHSAHSAASVLARPPLPSPALRSCWRNQVPGSQHRVWSKLQKALLRWENVQANSSRLAGPRLGGLRHVKCFGCLVAPLPEPEAIWTPLEANDFHRCCGLILLRTTVPRSILQMEIPDRGGERGRGGLLAAEIMQEVPEAGKKKKVRPQWGSYHPNRPSWVDSGFPRHSSSSEHPVSKQGHLTG